ncbi:MAG: UDP-N-acetylmuramoyl-tripeptide--D-alanyl-D-alanine ligase [Bacteroidales bacterium]
MNIEEIYKIFELHPKISTDSRNIIPDSLFFALKGENFDGNTFAEFSLNNGAAFAIIDNAKYYKGKQYILVENVLKTMQSLAAFHRNTLTIPIIGITGTNGKTTTKELINSVLSQKYKVLATIGNLNNHIGVPLTLLSIKEEHEIAIIEMGANHIGEIKELCEISNPDFGIITNIGKAHLEGFGGIEGVIQTKNDLYKAIRKKKGKVFVNFNNELLMNLSEGIKKITYGENTSAYCSGKLLNANPFVNIQYCCTDLYDEIQTQLIGIYNLENILAAIAIGFYFNVPQIQIKKSLEAYKPGNNRSQVLKTSKNTLVLDAYNANPSSLAAAIRNFSEIYAENKVIIIGDMLELGIYSKEEHLNILKIIEELDFQKVLLIGNEFSSVCNHSLWNCFQDSESAKNWFFKNPIENAFILIKGSRGIKMEKIIEAL